MPQLLLLAGTSETARMVLIDRLLSAYPEWQHLALEDLREDGDWQTELDMQDMFGAMVACDCAIEVYDQGKPVVVTCPHLDLLDTVCDALPDHMITIYMGANAVGLDFDHQIDTTENSSNEIFDFLCTLIS